MALGLAACGESGPDYAAAMTQVNASFGEAMKSQKTGNDNADKPDVACPAYRQAIAKLDAAMKMMADTKAPDEKKAQAIRWNEATAQMTEQKARITRAMKACPA